MAATGLPDHYPEERHPVSVMFAVVQGLTVFAEGLEYKAGEETIKEVWLQLDRVIESHGGHVQSHLGNIVVAVWGVPYAGDNDADKAVQAGLAMQGAVEEYADYSSRVDVKELSVRVAIDTGVAFAGYVGARREYTVVGDVVNIANELTHAIHAEGVLISENTFRRVRGAFQVQQLDPVSLPGRKEAVTVFLVEDVLVTAGRVRYGGMESLQTNMVGRNTEISRLQALYRQAVYADRPTFVIITGEEGMGKSRLLMEFTSWMEANDPAFFLLSARALALTSQLPFYLWKQVWRNRFGLQNRDSLEVAQGKFLREVQRLRAGHLRPIPAIEVAHLVGSLTGLDWPDSPYLARLADDPLERLGRVYELTRELLCLACNVRPTVLVLDDLQWADQSSLDLLSSLLLPATSPLPLLILGGAHPEFLNQQPQFEEQAKVIYLESLPVNAEMVAAAYPALQVLPEPVLMELAQQSGGNPYFLEEIVKRLVRGGILEGSGSTQDMLEQVRGDPPGSVQGILKRRIDDLTHKARSVLLLAAVVGRIFWVGAVAAAAKAGLGALVEGGVISASTLEDHHIQDGLRQLVRAEMVFPRANSEYSSDQEYIFKHTLLREVAYSMVPEESRAQYHLVVADWMSRRDDLDFYVMAADHYEQAGDKMGAVQLYEQAAEYAQSRKASSEAEALRVRSSVLRSQTEQEV